MNRHYTEYRWHTAYRHHNRYRWYTAYRLSTDLQKIDCDTGYA